MSEHDEHYGPKMFGGVRLERQEGREREGMVPSAKHIQGGHDAIDVMEGPSCIYQCICQSKYQSGKIR